MATIDASGGTNGTAKPEPAKETPKLGLDLTKDTVTRGDKASGLGEVFVQMDTNALADDVADLALGALKAKGVATPWRVRIVTDPAAMRGADLLAVLSYQAEALRTALDAALGIEPDVPPQSPWNVTALTGPAVVGAANVALQGVGIVSKLLAHDYQLSGRAVDAKDLGFDLLVAQKLRLKHANGVQVTVDRVAPSDTSTGIAKALSELETRARTELAPCVERAAWVAASTASDVEALTGQRDAFDAQLIELIKKIDQQAAVTQIGEVRAMRETVANALVMARAVAAATKAAHDGLAALAKEIETFVTTATTAPANGRAPLVEAARAEAFAKDTYVLYVRLLAGGMDEIVDVRALRSDTWTTLAGATAEFALVEGDVVLTSGVRSTLQATEVDLDDVKDIKQGYVNYVGVPQFTT